MVSNKMMKTAVVVVESTKTHPMYGKSFVHTKKYLVDDPENVKVGDIVEFIKVAPVSKNKHWRITKVVGKDLIAVETEVMKEVAKEAIEEVMPVVELSAISDQPSAEERIDLVEEKKPLQKKNKPKTRKEKSESSKLTTKS